MLAVKIVFRVRLGFIWQFRLEWTSGVLLANLLHKAESAMRPDEVAQGFNPVWYWKPPRMETIQPLRATCSYVWLSSWRGGKLFFKLSLNLSRFSLYLALAFDDLLVGTGGLLFNPLQVSPSPSWTGTPLAHAACSLPRPSGPFQQGCSPACCHFWANHRQAY